MPNDYRNLYTPLKQQEDENDIQNVYQHSIEPELRQDLQNEYDSRETSILDKILKAQQPSVNPLLSLMPSNQPKQAPQGAAIGVQVSKEDVFNNPEKQVKTLEKSIKTVSSEKPKEEKVIEFGDENQSSVVGLKSAQEKQSDVKFANNIVRALNAGADRMLQYQGKENPVFDAIDKQADDIVNNYKAQIGAAADDPDSSYSQGMRNYFKTQFGIEIKGKASAAQLNQLMPSASRAYEADLERQAKKDLADEARRERAREFNLRQQELGIRKDEVKATKDAARQDRLAKEAKLSDAQVEKINSYDKAIDSLGEIDNQFSQIGNKFVGSPKALAFKGSSNIPLIGNVVGDLMKRGLSADEAEFAAAVGRNFDIYRKEITGAGAGAKEIATLEKNTPNITDTPEQFTAKLQNLKQLSSQVKEKYLTNLEKGQGKNVSSFRGESEPTKPEKMVVKKGYNPKTNQTQFIYNDGSKEIVDGRK